MKFSIYLNRRVFVMGATIVKDCQLEGLEQGNYNEYTKGCFQGVISIDNVCFMEKKERAIVLLLAIIRGVNSNAFLFTTITKTRLFKYTENLTTKNCKFSDKNSIFFFHISAQKHRLWVIVRTASARRF